MATQFHLPGRHSPSAPRFDPRRPTELPVYFEELDYLFSLAAIHNDQEKKKLSRRYLAIDDSEYWETIPQYSADYSFDLFKQEIFKSYPGSLQERRFTYSDLERFISDTKRQGIASLADLLAYYRQFCHKSTDLVRRGAISSGEHSRLFLQAFSPSLQQRVHQRLQMKLPDHFPDDPYLLDDIQSAAKSVLQSAIIFAPATSESAIFPTSTTHTASHSQDITSETLTSIAQA
ncbi:hypothetical protein JOM56_013490, partial [Amanita muscaria]